MLKLSLFLILNGALYCSVFGLLNDTSIVVRFTNEDYHEEDASKRVKEFEKRGGIVVYRVWPEQDILHYLLLLAIHEENSFNPPNGIFKTGISQLDGALHVLEEQTGIKKSDIKIIPDFQVVTKFEHNVIPMRNVFFVAQLLNPNQTITVPKQFKRHTWAWYLEASLLSRYRNQTELYKACQRYFVDRKIVTWRNKNQESPTSDFIKSTGTN